MVRNWSSVRLRLAPQTARELGVAGDEGTRGAGGDLVKALIVEVGDVEHHAGVLHLRKRLDAGGGEAGVGIVSARERSLAHSS